MSHFNPGLISAYNSLTDKHLAGYFSNTRIRRHLQRAGLITRSGRIVPDKEYRLKLIQRAHQRHVRECLAQAIFHKVLEMERLHQIEIKRKLEEFARRERVHKIKVGLSRRYEEDIHILSPRPPTGARAIRKQHCGPEGDHSESTDSPGSSRPNTAPGKMQRPVRLKPLHSNNTAASLRRSSPYRLHTSSNENEQPFTCTLEKESRRRLTTMDAPRGISPYCLPVINNFVMPVPPATKRKERGLKSTPSSTLRGRRLRPATTSDINEELPTLRSSVYQSRVCVNMVYFGKTVHLSHDLVDMMDEVKVFQQHCGGENLCVYKGKLREGEMFQFISRRHRGFPFSLTFFLNGLQVERLSSCCEFKHRKGSRLGGRHGHFGFTGIERASPCYKCIIAMGLDKKPTPPPKRVKENRGIGESVLTPKDATEMETERTGEGTSPVSECESRRMKDTEVPVKDPTAPEDNKLRDVDYEEDFEADDEGAAEEAEPMKTASPSGEAEVAAGSQASDTEDNDKDDDVKSNSGSTSAASDRNESDTEATKDSREEDETEKATEVHQEETAAPPDEPNLDEPAATEVEPAVTGDSDLQDGAELEVSDTSVPTGNENKQTDHISAHEEDEKTHRSTEEEEERKRAKSVQERLVEAILKKSHCSSDPELSDTSTEEEEESTRHKQTLKADVHKAEPKGEENVTGEAQSVQEHDDAAEPKEHKEEIEEPQKSCESPREDTVKKEAEHVEKASTEEKQDKSEDTGVAPPPVSEDELPEDDKTSEPQEDAAAAADDDDDAEKDEESNEKNTVEAVQEERREEEDESSVSVNEAAKTGNAEATSASETIKMKAEQSEEQKALSCEEAPVTGRPQDDGEDITAGSEVPAENSSSSSDRSRNTTVHAEKTGDTKEDSQDTKEEEAEETSASAEASQDDKQECDVEEVKTETCEEIEVEKEKCEEKESKEEEQTNPGELAGDSSEVRDKTEEDGKDKSQTEDKLENEEGIIEETKTNLNAEVKSNKDAAEDAEEQELGDKEKDKDQNNVKSEHVEIEDDVEKSEEKLGESIKSEGINDRDAGDKMNDEAEETKKDENDNETEENEDEKSVEKENVRTADMDEGETEKILDRSMKMSDEDIVKSEDVSAREAADAGNDTTEENKMINVAVKSEKESENGERGEVDAESGEISTREGGQTNEDEPVNPTDKEGKTSEQIKEEGKTEPENGENVSVKKESAESEDIAEKQEDDKAEQAPAAHKAGGEEEDATQRDFQSVQSATEIKEESKSDDRNRSRRNSATEETNDEDTPLEAEVQKPSATATDLDGTAHKPDKEERNQHTGENAAGASLSVGEVENGAGAEEVSKASEEGASVLLKPQPQPAQLTSNDADDSREEVPPTPEELAEENSTDLVTNWVTVHQTSKYFETFVEPLEDLRDSAADVPGSKKEESQSGELRSATPVRNENEHTPNDANGNISRVESVKSDPDEPSENDPGEDTLQVEKDEVEHLEPNTKNESNNSESELPKKDVGLEESKESSGSFGEVQVQDRTIQINENDAFKTEVESISGSNHSGAARKDETITEERTIENGPDLDKKQPVSADVKHEELHSDSPEGLSKLAQVDEQTSAGEKMVKTQEEHTEITDFITSTSEVGSHEEPQNGRVMGDRRGVHLIQDVPHTPSKDNLSTFSVDETLFGPSRDGDLGLRLGLESHLNRSHM